MPAEARVEDLHRRPSVLHVNDCGHVAETLCTEAVRRGLCWGRYQPSTGRRHPVLTATHRLGEVARFRAVARPYDLLHVHYGLMSYYAMASGKPFVLHLHGTDIRTAIHQNEIYRQLLRWGLRNAARVYYSTPDLAGTTLQHRSDAQWLPAAVSDAGETPPVKGSGSDENGGQPRILLCSRWDEVKGAAELRTIAVRLRQLRPDVRVLGVEWGHQAALAEAAGVELLPAMAHSAFRRLLGDVDLVIGQMRSRALGVTELEALAAGTPVVMYMDPGTPYVCPPPIVRADPESAPAAALRLLDDRSRAATLGQSGPEWVRRFHGVETIVARLAEDYEEVLQSAGSSRRAGHEPAQGRASRPMR